MKGNLSKDPLINTLTDRKFIKNMDLDMFHHEKHSVAYIQEMINEFRHSSIYDIRANWEANKDEYRDKCEECKHVIFCIITCERDINFYAWYDKNFELSSDFRDVTKGIVILSLALKAKRPIQIINYIIDKYNLLEHKARVQDSTVFGYACDYSFDIAKYIFEQFESPALDVNLIELTVCGKTMVVSEILYNAVHRKQYALVEFIRKNYRIKPNEYGIILAYCARES